MTRSWAFFPVLFVFACHAGADVEGESFLPAEYRDFGKTCSIETLRTAMRIRSQRRIGGDIITGHGTAFGIDLAKYGHLAPRYMLSAGHVVLDERGQVERSLSIEIPGITGTAWHSCKVLAIDTDLDICLLESEVDLLQLAPFADEDVAEGAPLMLIGCKANTPPHPYPGQLTDKNYTDHLSKAQMSSFYHGDSGGPMFDARSEKLIGVAVAGIPRNGDMARDVGLFVPLSYVRRFVASAVLKIPAASHVVVRAPGLPDGRLVLQTTPEELPPIHMPRVKEPIAVLIPREKESGTARIVVTTKQGKPVARGFFESAESVCSREDEAPPARAIAARPVAARPVAAPAPARKVPFLTEAIEYGSSGAFMP